MLEEYKLSEDTSQFISAKAQQILINGQWIGCNSKDHIEIVNPATEEVVSAIGVATSEDVDKAIDSARKAFNDSKWRHMLPVKKERLLLKLADAMEEQLETIAEILTLENGKLFSHAKGEVKGAINTFRYYAGWATKMEGQVVDISLKQGPGKQNFSYIKREPVGVVAAIVPWNFPISIAAWKLAPLLAAGCTVVLKPSEVTPLSTLYFARLFAEVGFPDGVVNVVTGDASTGAALTQSAKIDKITFTGSTQVGKIIGTAAMQNLTDISLEMGGKSPAIICEDADIKAAAAGIAKGIFRNGGQVCVAGSRAYIHKDVYDKVLAAVAQAADKMKIGHGFDPNSDLGPLVSQQHLEKVCAFIETGKSEGAYLLTGGKQRKVSRKGYYLQPTIFTETDDKHSIVTDEIFGPVLIAEPFDKLETAITKANNSIFGLAATVWTRNISTALQCVDALDAGLVSVNSPTRSDPNFPLGGNKQSGIGRELGKVGLYNFTKVKAVNIVY